MVKSLANPHGYELREVVTGGIIIVMSDEYGQQLWVQANGVNNTVRSCVLCGRTFPPRTEVLWRPFGNGANRSHRMCNACVATWNQQKLAEYQAEHPEDRFGKGGPDHGTPGPDPV